jgi:hypothetical protein
MNMGNASMVEIVWIIIALFGLYFSIRLAWRGWRLLQTAHVRCITDARVEVVRGFLVRGIIKSAIFSWAIVIGIVAIQTSTPSNQSQLTLGTASILLVEFLVMLLVANDELIHNRVSSEFEQNGYLDLDSAPPMEVE